MTSNYFDIEELYVLILFHESDKTILDKIISKYFQNDHYCYIEHGCVILYAKDTTTFTTMIAISQNCRYRVTVLKLSGFESSDPNIEKRIKDFKSSIENQSN